MTVPAASLRASTIPDRASAVLRRASTAAGPRYRHASRASRPRGTTRRQHGGQTAGAGSRTAGASTTDGASTTVGVRKGGAVIVRAAPSGRAGPAAPVWLRPARP